MNLLHIETELEAITKMIWQPHLLDELVRIYDLDEATKTSATLCACVHILGGWNGSVSIECSKQMAEWVSRRMLYIDDDIEDYDWQSVMKELCNVTGGNLKGLLGENCILSTPRALECNNFSFVIPETDEILSLIFSCSDEYMIVRLHEGTIDYSLVDQ
ncbi:MAG: chemotaxis protein CheX [Deltaproteobacteria bacterium]|nr:chemotaxis protein CheX [Deltaproteobacteria bacterium]